MDVQTEHEADAKREDADRDAKDGMERLEAGETVPHDPLDWPQGKLKSLTFGSTGDHAYGDGPTAMLGPADVQHHEDGSVSVGGRRVDNPGDFKGPPIPGGPTDPGAAKIAGERDAPRRSLPAPPTAAAPAPRSRGRRFAGRLGAQAVAVIFAAVFLALIVVAVAGGAALAP